MSAPDRGPKRPEGPVRVLFVCLGNICRSPTAEGVMRVLVRDAGLEDRIELDSAGTGSWHIGDAPDPRATAAARDRGIALLGEARQVERGDFADFDLIVAMDRQNLADLRHIAPDDVAREKVVLLRDLDPATAGQKLDVPDPYHGGSRGFEHVLDLVHDACSALLDQIRERISVSPDDRATPAADGAQESVPLDDRAAPAGELP